MTAKAKKAWDELNERQQIYLKTFYHADQSQEEAHRKEAARTWSSTPARTWRRLDFNGRYSSIAPVLRAKKVYDSGAGSTLAALRDRGLIESETWTGLLTDPVYVWITREGRAAVRAGLGYGPVSSSKPKWALSEWLWKELVKVAAAGPDGYRIRSLDPRHGLSPDAHLYLSKGSEGRRGNRPYIDGSNYRWVTYDAKVNPWVSNETYKKSEPVYYYVLTPEGRAHYAEYLEQYRELYPDVEAPDLPEPTAAEPD